MINLKKGRLKILPKMSNVSSFYQLSAIVDVYAAWLRQIEILKNVYKKTVHNYPERAELCPHKRKLLCTFGNTHFV